MIIGAAGGAAYQKKPNAYEQPRWEVTVKLDNGRRASATLNYEPLVRKATACASRATASSSIE